MSRKILRYLLICQGFFLACHTETTKESTCEEELYICDEGQPGVSFLKFCDGRQDCKNGIDESYTTCQKSMGVALYGGKNDSYGKLRIRFLDNKWRNLWSPGFTQEDAKVVCHMLGYDGPSSVMYDNIEGPILKRTWFGRLNCMGSESSIDDCYDKPYQAGIGCRDVDIVSVSCSPGPLSCGRGNYLTKGQRYVTSDPWVKTFTKIDDHQHMDLNNLLSRQARGIVTVAHPRHRRIVEGATADTLENFPWIADLSLKVEDHWIENTTLGYQMCGAAIISEYFLLTAAHCLTWLVPEFGEKLTKVLRVTVGEFYQLELDILEEVFEVDAVSIHNGYNELANYINDIALIKVKAKDGHGIYFNKHTQPVCLPSPETPLIETFLAVAGGWGISRTAHDMGVGMSSKYLYLTQLPLLSPSLCDKYTKERRFLHPGQLCAGYVGEGTSVCNGDSGGPLVQSINGHFTLLGLTSFGPKDCGRANDPAVFTNVKHYLPWIFQNMRLM